MPIQPKGFPAFQEFIDSASSAKADTYLSSDDASVTNEEAFGEMQSHILGLYEGVEVQNSFADENGQIFDCIPIEQQPSLKGTDGKIPEPPEIPFVEELAGDPPAPDDAPPFKPQVNAGEEDRYGNQKQCPEGTIAMRRITLEEMTRFETLRNFFQKGPGGGGHPRLNDSNQQDKVHKYAFGRQTADRIMGANSRMNIWQPRIENNESFSLSQIWISGGSGEGLQTIETGWTVNPGRFGTYPALFIYTTPDNYNSGNYNLDGGVFVQTGSHVILGGALLPSVPGSMQEMWFFWAFIGNLWSLYLTTQQTRQIPLRVGHYLPSAFRGGALRGTANAVDFGGETARKPGSQVPWPPMGSGEFAKEGYGKAAYQKALTYDVDLKIYKADLIPHETAPTCYTIKVITDGETEIYFGGPGGDNC